MGPATPFAGNHWLVTWLTSLGFCATFWAQILRKGRAIIVKPKLVKAQASASTACKAGEFSAV